MAKRVGLGLLLAACTVVLASCGSSQPQAVQTSPNEWPYESHAISLTLKGDGQLNYEAGTAHALVVCVFQLSDPNNFNEQRQSEGNLTQLLEKGSETQGVVHFQRHYLQPGEYKTLRLDRAENAKYVGIVAGYYNLTPGKVDCLFQIPVITQKQGGWLGSTSTLVPGKTSIGLILGPREILQSKQQNG